MTEYILVDNTYGEFNKIRVLPNTPEAKETIDKWDETILGIFCTKQEVKDILSTTYEAYYKWKSKKQLDKDVAEVMDMVSKIS